MNDLAQALATYSPLGKRYWRTKMLWSIGFLAFALAFFITPLVQEYITFAQDALRDDWGAFLGTFFDGSGPPALYPVVSLGWTLVFVRPDWRRHANARAFRVAILQRTNLSTPFPPDQQAALYAGEQAALPTAFGPFQDVLYRQRRGLYGLAIGLPLAGACCSPQRRLACRPTQCDLGDRGVRGICACVGLCAALAAALGMAAKPPALAGSR